MALSVSERYVHYLAHDRELYYGIKVRHEHLLLTINTISHIALDQLALPTKLCLALGKGIVTFGDWANSILDEDRVECDTSLNCDAYFARQNPALVFYDAPGNLMVWSWTEDGQFGECYHLGYEKDHYEWLRYWSTTAALNPQIFLDETEKHLIPSPLPILPSPSFESLFETICDPSKYPPAIAEMIARYVYAEKILNLVVGVYTLRGTLSLQHTRFKLIECKPRA
jgi:hypothetical protein